MRFAGKVKSGKTAEITTNFVSYCCFKEKFNQKLLRYSKFSGRINYYGNSILVILGLLFFANQYVKVHVWQEN